ncbi:hypothetical protein ASF03_21335 [Rhizobium sp. Leaf68]|nr:hypothetical protein ASE62_20790 [Rhizobium sp. Leaf202]KQN80468.1 hypothetical protein ASF03_21335 [Rhizobium sp. Leaf68]
MIVKELSIGDLNGIIEFLSYQGKKGDETQREAAMDCLRLVIESVPAKPVSIEEAVSLHALAIAIIKGLPANRDDPAAIEVLSGYAATLMEKSGLALEYLSGFKIDAYRHFEDMTPAAQH